MNTGTPEAAYEDGRNDALTGAPPIPPLETQADYVIHYNLGFRDASLAIRTW